MRKRHKEEIVIDKKEKKVKIIKQRAREKEINRPVWEQNNTGDDFQGR